MKYKSKIAAIIAAYKSRNSPYTPSKDYRHRLEGLMSELVEASKRPWSFEDCENYFNHYCYLYLNPLKPGNFKYVLPSGKVLCLKFEPFYAGKGTRDRFKSHLRTDASETNKHKINTIKKIRDAGLEPIIKVTASRVSNYLACAFEIDMIAGIGRRDLKTGDLTNGTDGGEGAVGRIFKHSDHSKALIGKASKGKKRSDAARANMSKAQRGRTLSPEHCAKISALQLGRVLPKETRTKMSISRIAYLALNPATDEFRAKMADIGRNISEETRRKRSESNKLAHARRKAALTI